MDFWQFRAETQVYIYNATELLLCDPDRESTFFRHFGKPWGRSTTSQNYVAIRHQ